MRLPVRTSCFSAVLFIFAVVAVCEEPVAKVTVCQLKSDPSSYNHKVVEVTGFVEHAFENFSVYDPTCPSWPWIWLEYGGTSKSGTMYCCGVSADRSRPKELVVEKIPIPLVVNKEFADFDKAIQPPFRSGQNGAVVHATLVGRFFSGRKIKYPKREVWGGYGHMGCCSLLAIQEIRSVDTENRSDLDYGAKPDQPDIGKTGCGYRFLLPLGETKALLNWQRKADAEGSDWLFSDPRRAASETLSSLVGVDEASLQTMKMTHEAQGRKVYEWKPEGKQQSYMIVVSRPYWLSFYSRDPSRVAWVPIGAYESSCGGNNSVTRIK